MKKILSTEQTPANIHRVLEILGGIPARLDHLAAGISESQRELPLGVGERSFHEVLAHLAHCEAVIHNVITLALLLEEPLIPPIHAERDLGKLWRYDLQPFTDLVAYFKFRRAVLMGLLRKLTEAEWSRPVRTPGKRRAESVYWQARSLALHEDEHLAWLEEKLLPPA